MRSLIALRYFQPAPDLRRFVSAYYLFRADGPGVADVVRADLAQLRFMLAGRGRYQFAECDLVDAPPVSLVGPTMSASRFEIVGPAIVFGAALLPTGWAAGIREEACSLVDRVADAGALFGRVVDDALDAMRAAPAAEVMVSIADAVLRVAFAHPHEPPGWFTSVTEAWLTGSAAPCVDTLVAESGISARQLARLANRIYGAPPKLLARKYRALRAAALLIDPRGDRRAAAADAFYDQSHFIREFKHFTGLTPRQYQSNPPPVTRLIQQRRGFAAQLPRICMAR